MNWLKRSLSKSSKNLPVYFYLITSVNNFLTTSFLSSSVEKMDGFVVLAPAVALL